MKKISIIFFNVLVFLSVSSFGKPGVKHFRGYNMSSRFSIGIAGGANMSTTMIDYNLVETKIIESDNKKTYNLYSTSSGFKSAAMYGITGNYFLAPGTYLQAEILFVQKGHTSSSGTFNNTIFNSNNGYDLNLNYLQFPIMLKVDLGKEGVSLPLFFGVYSSTAVSGSLTSGGMTQKIQFDESDHFRRMDFGLLVGTGMQYIFGKNRIGIESFLNYGVVNAFPHPSENGFENLNFSVRLGYSHTL